MFTAILALAAGAQQTPLIIDRGRLDRRTERRQRPAKLPRRATTAIVAEAPQTTITAIVFNGEKAPGPVAAAAQGFIGRKAAKATLEQLAGALSAAYARSNVAFYTVAIGEQDFALGAVRIDLIEGHVAATTIDDATGRPHPRARRLAEGLIGIRPLSRTRFERQISLMRDIPGLEFDLAAATAGPDGALALTVTPRQQRRKFTGGYTSRGTALVGDGQFDAALTFYGAAVDGDELSLTGAAAADFRSFLYAAAGYRAPIGYGGLTASLTAGYLRTRPKRTPIDGDARSLSLGLSYPIVRSFERDVVISGSLDGLNSDNAAFGSVIAAERVRAARAGAAVSLRKEKRTIEASLTASKGLGGIGARVDPLSGEEKFAKLNAEAAVAKQIGRRLIARARLSGQFTRDALPATERFAVGGESFGRAFDSGVLSADRGAAASAELAWLPFKTERLAATELYGFIDGAKVRVLARPGFAARDFDLASAGGGVRLRYREKASLDLEAARALDHPFAGARDNWGFTVGWRLSL